MTSRVRPANGGILIVMIRATRRSRVAQSIAALGVWAVLSVIVAGELHHGADDPECQTAVGGGSNATVHPAPASGVATPVQHCLICHAFQSVRAEQVCARVCPPQSASGLAVAAPFLAVPWLLASATPARAPPSA